MLLRLPFELLFTLLPAVEAALIAMGKVFLDVGTYRAETARAVGDPDLARADGGTQPVPDDVVRALYQEAWPHAEDRPALS